MEILLKLRKEKGVTQKDLAEYLQISRQAYANYEAGNRNPDFETLIKISEYFDVSVDYLLGKANNYSSVSEEPLPTQTEQENTLLKAFRGTTEEGRMRIIQAVLNICDDIEREQTKTKSQNAVG